MEHSAAPRAPARAEAPPPPGTDDFAAKASQNAWQDWFISWSAMESLILFSIKAALPLPSPKTSGQQALDTR